MANSVIQILSFIFVAAGFLSSDRLMAAPLSEDDTVVIAFKRVKASSENHPAFLPMPDFYMKVGVGSSWLSSNSWITSRWTNKYSVKRNTLDKTTETELYPIFYPVKVIADKARERQGDRVDELTGQIKKVSKELKLATEEWNRTHKTDWRERISKYQEFCPVGSTRWHSAYVSLPGDHKEFCQLLDLEESYTFLSKKLVKLKAESSGRFPPDLEKLNIKLYQDGYLIEYLFAIFSWEMQSSVGDVHIGSICEDREHCGLSLEQLEKLKNGKMNDFELGYLRPARTENPDIFTISIGVFSREEIQAIQDQRPNRPTQQARQVKGTAGSN